MRAFASHRQLHSSGVSRRVGNLRSLSVRPVAAVKPNAEKPAVHSDVVRLAEVCEERFPVLSTSPLASLTRDVNLTTAVPLALLMLAALAQPALAFTPPPEISIPGIIGDDPVREGFVSGFFLIFFSELGDKTFFLALLLALQSSKQAVFVGTFGALAVMTVISVGLGVALHEVDGFLPFDTSKFPVDDLLASALLIWFGVRTLSGADGFTAKANEEKEEAEEVVAESKLTDKDTLTLILSTFALVFAAEWGDKSFLATIALAAASSPVGVVGGAVAGHGIATAVAVLGGSVLSNYVSEKVVAYVGGSLFLVFAASTLVDIARGLGVQ